VNNAYVGGARYGFYHTTHENRKYIWDQTPTYAEIESYVPAGISAMSYNGGSDSSFGLGKYLVGSVSETGGGYANGFDFFRTCESFFAGFSIFNGKKMTKKKITSATLSISKNGTIYYTLANSISTSAPIYGGTSCGSSLDITSALDNANRNGTPLYIIFATDAATPSWTETDGSAITLYKPGDPNTYISWNRKEIESPGTTTAENRVNSVSLSYTWAYDNSVV